MNLNDDDDDDHATDRLHCCKININNIGPITVIGKSQQPKPSPTRRSYICKTYNTDFLTTIGGVVVPGARGAGVVSGGTGSIATGELVTGSGGATTGDNVGITGCGEVKVGATGGVVPVGSVTGDAVVVVTAAGGFVARGGAIAG